MSPLPAYGERGPEGVGGSQQKGVRNLFGTTVPAFFTDEPQFVKKSMFTHGDEQHDLFMPISEDFFDTYGATFEQDLLDHLPELFWNLPGRPAPWGECARAAEGGAVRQNGRMASAICWP